MPRSKLSPQQILQEAYDEANQALRVTGDYAPADTTPTISEMMMAVEATTGTVVNTSEYPIFIAMFPLKIVAASLAIYETAGIAADSDTIYWTVEIRRTRANSSVVIASKHTKLTGGEAVGLRTGWNLDAATFDPANQICAKDDIIDVRFLETGTTPVGWAKPHVTVRYEPV